MCTMDRGQDGSGFTCSTLLRSPQGTFRFLPPSYIVMLFYLPPPEIIVRIIQHLEPTDLRTIKGICRLFRDLVDSDFYLQYVLELEKSRYVIPRVIRQELTYVDMIQTLRDQRDRWWHLKPRS
ncbi:hypothetical protein B0J17DRAFT_646287 [Rhizoctonia solani]|nr:hypothetical protein B0J17DRAFT_646287 [Rhizoctonia solani]